MAPLLKSRSIEIQNVEIKNMLARSEAKLDFLLKSTLDPKELSGLKLPEPLPLPDAVAVEPFNVRTENRISTAAIPKAVATEFKGAPTVVPKGKDSLQTPKTPVSHAPASVAVLDAEMEPIKGYNALMIGEVLKKVKEIKTKEQRDVMLDYERRHQNREQVVEALVNWSS